MAHLLLNFRDRMPDRHLILNLWCDCGGMGVEVFSLAHVAEELREIGLGLNFSVYMSL